MPCNWSGLKAKQQEKPNKSHAPVVKAALCHNAYDKIGLRALSKAGERQTTKVTTMPRALMCIIGR